MKFNNIILGILPIEKMTSTFFKTHSGMQPVQENELLKLKYFLSDTEIKKASGCRTYKRQIEYISGRYCLKFLLNTYSCFKSSAILTYPTGAPYLHNYPEHGISISHSGSYAIAAVNRGIGNIGVDIETLPDSIAEEFMAVGFSAVERKRYKHDNCEQIIKYWTIKEAYLKYIQEGFATNLHSVEIINNTINKDHQPVTGLDCITKKIDTKHIFSLVYKKN